jgi:lipopolysaccharide export LptBFGC system permease protein LptF
MRFDSPDANRVQLWLKPEGTTEIIPSISLALANTYEKGIPQPPQLFAPMLVKIEDYEQRVDQANASRFTYATTLVNYSMLDAIESQSLAATSHYTIDDNDWRFQDKLVLIGRLNWTNRLIRVIGRNSDAPGVLLDAAATYSLIKSPLFEFTTKARVLIDIVLSLLVLSLVTLARFRNRKNALYDWRGTQWLLVLAMVTVVFVGGIILVRSTGIIWFDFLAVIIVLLFHPVVEKKLGARINQLTKRN